ncbi:SepM family pheromone-processing serine protease [Isobaculum melis]|uniref:endopeptidase La n=1 Tax=Isobaculum melis TaxID=142588 RepID=A0A1H9RUH6_9LACT|nr:SepM family pheromone-processing serine protease [Isobaculum melis]SER76510.1 PDZ domain-containing protein [Isobaculum melis]
MKEKIKKYKIPLILVSFIALLFIGYFPLDYYIESPGNAVRLNDLVEVDHEYDQNDGSYMLTTVRIAKATPLTYFFQYLPFREGIKSTDLFDEDQSEDEYDIEQQHAMSSSINSAIQVAFTAADEPYEVDYHGIYVLSVLKESQLYQQIKAGDTITSIDDQPFESAQEFTAYISSKEIGDKISIAYENAAGNNEKLTTELIDLGEGRAGIGITLIDDYTVTPSKPVSIATDRIGGPSAGFMFTLAIYTQLTNEDLRNGREIAGTGTMSPDGTVGRIGGIDKKVVAADKEGAEIFFAPDDEITPEMKEIYPDIKTNYEEAKEAAEKCQTKMKIVPIRHFQDALDYLKEHS